MHRTYLRRRLISYVTDVEGDLAYLDRFLGISALVRSPLQSDESTPCSSGPPIADTLADVTGYSSDPREIRFKDATSHFVYGGDAFDHGPDLAFAQSLLDFKARYPDRVHLILGNRDVNKMVFSPAIEKVGQHTVADAEHNVFYLHHSWRAPAESYVAYLSRMGLAANKTHADPISFLQWALKNKMGSPNSFEYRRMELQSTRSCGGSVISDEEVAESFFAAARPGGLYDRYMEQGVMMTAIDNILFVHGGATETNIGFVPDVATPTAIAQPEKGRHMVAEDCGVHEWIAAMEEFKRVSLAEWREGRGLCGEALRQYVFPKMCAPYSTTVNTCVEQDGLRYAPLSVVGYLLGSGLHTVCSGHQPVGDTPAMVSQPGGFFMLCADNSYSGRGNEYCTPGVNTRGKAVQEVIVDSAEGPLCIHGARANGEPFSFSPVRDPLLGQCAGDGWWVKVPLRRNPECGKTTYYLMQPHDLVCRSSSGGGTDNVNGDALPYREATHYELHRTRDSFHTEEVCIVETEEVVRRVKNYREEAHVPLRGELPQKYTPRQLANVYQHRIKTKVPVSDGVRAA